MQLKNSKLVAEYKITIKPSAIKELEDIPKKIAQLIVKIRLRYGVTLFRLRLRYGVTF